MMSPSLLQLYILLHKIHPVPETSKPGTCPAAEPVGGCTGQCTADVNCGGTQKCCATQRCDRICRDPLNNPINPNRSKYFSQQLSYDIAKLNSC